MLAHRGAVLETVAGASTYQPHVVQMWMAIEYEMFVRTVLVLTHSRLEQRSSLEAGESELDILACRRQCRGGVRSLSGRGIERLAATIVSDLEPTPLASWNSVEDRLAVIDPNRKVGGRVAMVSGRRAEIKDFLASRADTIS